MKRARWLSSLALLALLIGCGGLPSSGTRPQGAFPATFARSGKALLYVGDSGTGYVLFYSYPRAKVLGRLRRSSGRVKTFSAPGECVDSAGELFVSDSFDHAIFKYSHGGSRPIAKLEDPGEDPSSCSVDPTTGDLAVANFENASAGPGSVSIYKRGAGRATTYSDPSFLYYFFCGYDASGNLFLDGKSQSQPFLFAELPKGNSTFVNIELNRQIQIPGDVQWDGTYVAVGDQGTNTIYQTDGSGGKVIGATVLKGASDVVGFAIEGSRVIGADYVGRYVGFWPYPSGGTATKIITGLSSPESVAVSVHK